MALKCISFVSHHPSLGTAVGFVRGKSDGWKLIHHLLSSFIQSYRIRPGGQNWFLVIPSPLRPSQESQHDLSPDPLSNLDPSAHPSTRKESSPMGYVPIFHLALLSHSCNPQSSWFQHLRRDWDHENRELGVSRTKAHAFDRFIFRGSLASHLTWSASQSSSNLSWVHDVSAQPSTDTLPLVLATTRHRLKTHWVRITSEL